MSRCPVPPTPQSLASPPLRPQRTPQTWHRVPPAPLPGVAERQVFGLLALGFPHTGGPPPRASVSLEASSGSWGADVDRAASISTRLGFSIPRGGHAFDKVAASSRGGTSSEDKLRVQRTPSNASPSSPGSASRAPAAGVLRAGRRVHPGVRGHCHAGELLTDFAAKPSARGTKGRGVGARGDQGGGSAGT